jgi:hypothetical protein
MIRELIIIMKCMVRGIIIIIGGNTYMVRELIWLD